jgi:hypothetical protein
MEAKDLRIGNLVYFNDLLLKFEFESGWNFDFIEPIQITEKWLLKFGFKSDDISWEYSKRLGNFYIMYDIEINSIYINDGSRYDGADIPNEIKHVHQLQNLYFALTGQELTLNN